MKKNEVLVKYRQNKGLTTKDMAKILEISQAYYSQLETNKRNVYYSMALKIAKVFNKKPDDIFYDMYSK